MLRMRGGLAKVDSGLFRHPYNAMPNLEGTVRRIASRRAKGTLHEFHLAHSD